MSPRRIYAIFSKELRHILRDTRVLLLVTLMPAFLLVMLSYVFSFDVQHTRIAVLDLDKTATSRDFVTVLTADGDFILQSYLTDYTGAQNVLLTGNATIALIIPHDFQQNLDAGHKPQLQAIVDGINPITAKQSIAQLDARTQAFAASRLAHIAPVVQVTQVADVVGRAWFNPAMKSLFSMVPGLLSVVLFMPAMALTVSLAREKESGSFEGLIATPVRGAEYLLGKQLAYALGGLVGTLAALLVAVFWFQVPFRGSVALFLALTGLYFFATMSTGTLIAQFVSSQQTAMTLFLLAFFIPSFFISGLINPLDPGSLVSQVMGNAIPATHYIVITRSIFLKGLGWAGLWPEALALAILGSVLFTISLVLFRKKVS